MSNKETKEKHEKLDKQTRDAFHQFARNGVWGTCVDCPRGEDGHVFPEFCKYFNRYDHELDLMSLVEYYE